MFMIQYDRLVHSVHNNNKTKQYTNYDVVSTKMPLGKGFLNPMEEQNKEQTKN